MSLVETLKNALSASAVSCNSVFYINIQIESEETRISSPKNVCITGKDEIPAIIPKSHQSNTSSDEQLNLSSDIDTQFQGCNVLDASRLRVSALDTSVISSLVRKESEYYGPSIMFVKNIFQTLQLIH